MKRVAVVFLFVALILSVIACLPDPSSGDAPPEEEGLDFTEDEVQEEEGFDFTEEEPEAPPDAQPEPPPSGGDPAPADPGAGEGNVIELEDMEVPPGQQLVCIDSGCTCTSLSIEDLRLVDPDGEHWFLPEDRDPSSYTQIICIVGDTCHFAKVTVEDMQIVQSDGTVFAALSDADLAGTWTIVNHPATVTCEHIGSIPLEQATDIGVITRAGDYLIGTGFSEDAPSLDFYRLGYGTYMSCLNISTGEGSVSFTYHLALQDDNTFFGFFTSKTTTPAGTCDVTRTFTGTR